ncbi:MAG: ABC transporter permease [Aeromicrobium sp.]|uniref:ABC transporter permease n=1 Tax=Aeromicrobium sp. TaxID=1871063 RepID=UPI002639D2DE|nr:ABC transporter permease [Aeromicrobium sp.]MDF1705297.1 ABC transporter permease [Aeromicrobium sp.]
MSTDTTKPVVSPAARRSLKSSSGAVSTPLSVTLGRYSAIILWAGFTILFGILRPDTFLSSVTWRLTFSEGVVTAIVALAFLVPLAAGVYDLSVGATMGTGLVLMNWFGLNHPGLPPWQVAIGVLAFCALIGFCSAVVIVKFRVQSLIATLGVSQVLLAFQLFMANNRQLTGAFESSWLDLGNGQVLGIPVVALYLLVLAVLMWFVLEHTPVGRRLFAVGSNPEAARLAGLNVERLTYGSLMTSAVIGGFAGIVFSMKVGTYNSSVGPGLLFPALAAVFFGASQFARRPNVWGTLIAYFALAFGVKGLQLTFGPGTFWIQPLFQGAALLIAVALASRVVGQTRRSRQLQREAAADDAQAAGEATPPPR